MGRKPKLTSYDGIYYARCIDVFLTNADALDPTNASVLINWGNAGINTATTRFINNIPEFLAFTGSFHQWRIVGLKIKVFPRRESNNDDSGIYDISRASNPEGVWTAATPDSTIIRATDYRTYPIAQAKPIKMYYNLKRFYAARSEKWLNSNSFYDQIAHTMVR